MLHQITKATLWWSGASLFRTREEDAENDATIKGKFKAWHDHWEVGQKVQEQKGLWEKQELGKDTLQLHSGWVFWETLRHVTRVPLGLS